jgi:hypothetical protein
MLKLTNQPKIPNIRRHSLNPAPSLLILGNTFSIFGKLVRILMRPELVQLVEEYFWYLYLYLGRRSQSCTFLVWGIGLPKAFHAYNVSVVGPSIYVISLCFM